MSSFADAAPYLTMVKLHAADHLTYLRANQILKQSGITVKRRSAARFSKPDFPDVSFIFGP